jgi:hypothetical protein
MSLSNKKILVSGCGLSYGLQKTRTWVNVLKSIGATIIDCSGPAVSNQWIINQSFLKLKHDPEIKNVILQLTGLGKLDVEITADRMSHLVETDSLRNFTIGNIWPSSVSTDHESKKLWSRWLSSPGLERQDIFCKLAMLSHWCTTHNIKLTVIQGYNINWTQQELHELSSIITDINTDIVTCYKQSSLFDQAFFDQHHGIPALDFQIELATKFVSVHCPELLDQISKLKKAILCSN